MSKTTGLSHPYARSLIPIHVTVADLVRDINKSTKDYLLKSVSYDSHGDDEGFFPTLGKYWYMICLSREDTKSLPLA